MGDSCYCLLHIAGTITSEHDWKHLQLVIAKADGQSITPKAANPGIVESQYDIDDAPNGDMHKELEKIIGDLGLFATWFNTLGEETPYGLQVLIPEEPSFFHHTDSQQNFALTLHEIDTPGFLPAVRRHQHIADLIQKAPLFYAPTAHARLALVEQHPVPYRALMDLHNYRAKK